MFFLNLTNFHKNTYICNFHLIRVFKLRQRLFLIELVLIQLLIIVVVLIHPLVVMHLLLKVLLLIGLLVHHVVVVISHSRVIHVVELIQ